MSKLKANTHLNELDKTKMNGYHNDLNNNNTKETLNGAKIHTDEELQRLVLNQLEFYFSRENLLHDKYLVSQMDNDSYVPISILITFNMIKKLFSNSSLASSQDEERIKFVQSLIQKSINSQLQLDASQTKIRANHKRCVVILREIDKETPIDNIKKIFDKCKVKCLNCEFAGSRSWYLTFKDEQEAQIAVQFIKEEVQQFNNEPLFARIKTNPIPRLVKNESNESSIENEPDIKPINYPQYPYYYHANFDVNQMPLLANPWLVYPPPPLPQPPTGHQPPNYPNFSKIKQTSTDSNSSNNNLSSSSSISNVSGYVMNPMEPFMFPYAPYPQYKLNYYRKNHKQKETTDTNSSQNDENDEDKRNFSRNNINNNSNNNNTSVNTNTNNNNNSNNNNNNRFNNYSMGSYNQNFIIFPTTTAAAAAAAAAATFAYPPQIPYNFGIYPSYAQPIAQPVNPASSSSSSTSSKPPAHTDNNGFKNNYQKKYKKYAPQTSKTTGTDNQDKFKTTKQNGKPVQNYQKKSRNNFSNRKFDSTEPIAQVFDYEPTSFPPLNDPKVEEVKPVETPEQESDDGDSSPWSANSRRSFAEIVKHKQLADELNKVKLAED